MFVSGKQFVVYVLTLCWTSKCSFFAKIAVPYCDSAKVSIIPLTCMILWLGMKITKSTMDFPQYLNLQWLWWDKGTISYFKVVFGQCMCWNIPSLFIIIDWWLKVSKDWNKLMFWLDPIKHMFASCDLNAFRLW